MSFKAIEIVTQPIGKECVLANGRKVPKDYDIEKYFCGIITDHIIEEGRDRGFAVKSLCPLAISSFKFVQKPEHRGALVPEV